MAKIRIVGTMRHGVLVAAMLVSLTACGGDSGSNTGGGSASGSTNGKPTTGTGSGTTTPPPATGSGSSTGTPSTNSGSSSSGSTGGSGSSGTSSNVPPPTPPVPTQPLPAGDPEPGTPAPPVATGPNPFDKYYASTFRLTRLAADPIVPAAKPPRATGFDTAFIDPAYGTRIYRATSADEGKARMRHEYSRRQAFNADNSRFLAQDGGGAWYLYDAQTFKKIRIIKELAGDCEPLWHPTDPSKLYYTSTIGGLVWWVYDINKQSKDVMFDFTGKTPWPKARSFWTKGEGSMSADGRYLALMATTYDNDAKTNTVYGFVMLDVLQKKIVGTLDASKFPSPNAMPDNVATSASGKYVVAMWTKGWGSTRAWTRDFSSSKMVFDGIEHSDLAFGPNREDYMVYADYGTGYIVATNLDTLSSFNITPLYQGNHEGYATHISGQAFDKPGWAVISTYLDSANYGSITPAPDVRPQYRKVFLAELKPNGRLLNVAHNRLKAQTDGTKDYFAEPQATPSRDLSRIIFSTNFGGDAPEDYIVGLPSWWDKSK